MELTKERIAFLIKLGGGTPEMEDPEHPQHHECIQRSVDNAFILMEIAQEYEHKLDQERFEKSYGTIYKPLSFLTL